MAARKSPDLAALENVIGHQFADARLLAQALTHVSAAPSRAQSNQRLEFLGDRVLGIVVANMLYAQFSEVDEGELSRRLAHLVRGETCAEIARGWGLGPHIRLGKGEDALRTNSNASLLADACEAVIAAVFLDGGFEAAARVVEASFAPKMQGYRGVLRDPKSALQEWAQARELPPPHYRLVTRSGPDHAPRFVVAAEITGLQPAEGDGASKRIAEQSAAQAFMEREGVSTSQRGAA